MVSEEIPFCGLVFHILDKLTATFEGNHPLFGNDKENVN